MRKASRVPEWRWRAPPGWPPPPDGWVAPKGWSPPPGWVPNPGCRPAPPGWVFFERTGFGQRRHRWPVALGASLAALLVFGSVGGCAAFVSMGDCFDPPPGSPATLTIRNDLASSIVVTGPSSSSYSGSHPIPPGRTFTDEEDPADGSPVYRIGDAATGTTLGCLAPPVTKGCDFTEVSFRASAMQACERKR